MQKCKFNYDGICNKTRHFCPFRDIEDCSQMEEDNWLDNPDHERDLKEE